MLCLLQFVATLTVNIKKLSGSPVLVTVESVTPGSVKVATTVVFLSGDSSSASTYTAALTSGETSSVFGTSFGGVGVDASSVKTATVTNPSESHAAMTTLHCAHCSIHCISLAAKIHQMAFYTTGRSSMSHLQC